MSTIFVAGAYGVGKSTLCSKVSTDMQIPFYSAGDLISGMNGEKYGTTKAVSDKNRNQVLLAEKVQELNQINDKIILAGHFCIFNKLDEVETLPDSVFFDLNIEQIILLEADENILVRHLHNRDGKTYSHQNIHQLVFAEQKQSMRIAKNIGVPLSIYQMTFSDKDAHNIVTYLQKGVSNNANFA